MARPHRLLTVEPFEDRVLPSVSFVPPGLERAAVRSHSGVPAQKLALREAGEHMAVTAWSGHIVTPTAVIHIRVEVWTPVIPVIPTWFFRGDTPEARSARTEVPAARGGAAEQGPFASAAATSAAGPVGRGVRAPAGQGTGPVSLAVPPDGTPAAAPAAEPAAPADVRPPAPIGSLILPAMAAPIFSSRVTFPLLAGLFPSVGAPDVVPVPEPTPGPAMPPADPVPADGLSVSRLAAAAVQGLPLGASVAVDAAALAASAASFLDQVSDLGAEWPDDRPDFEDYAWTAAAILLAGAAVHTALSRKADRRPRDVLGIDSVLAEREGWDGRRSG